MSKFIVMKPRSPKVQIPNHTETKLGKLEMNYNWTSTDAGNELRSARVREIEARMSAFLHEKQGVAEGSTIKKVQAARDDVRKLISVS